MDRLDARALILDLRRLDFAEHAELPRGVVWAWREFRFLTPREWSTWSHYGALKDRLVDTIAERWGAWEALKARIDAVYPTAQQDRRAARRDEEVGFFMAGHEKDAINAYREILRDMRRHGFEQLRMTPHGVLYGFKEHRVTVATKVPAHAAGFSVQELQKEWHRVRENVYATYPGVKFRITKNRADNARGDPLAGMAPFANPEDVLLDLDQEPGDVAGASPAVASSAAGGSTPPVSTTDAEATPTTEPPATPAMSEDDPMATKTKRTMKFRKCPVPGCDGKAAGKHTEMHRRRGEWKSEYDSPGALRVRAAKAAPKGIDVPVTRKTAGAATASVNGVQTALDALGKAFGDLVFERDYYKKQLDENAGVIDRLREAFNVTVPRKRPER